MNEGVKKVQLMTHRLIQLVEKKAVLTMIWTESKKRLPRARGRWALTQDPSMSSKDVPRFEWHVGWRGRKARPEDVTERRGWKDVA